MEKNKNISFKNYILLGITLILTIIIVIYLFMWHNSNEENNLKAPIMDKCLRVIKYNELNDFLIENKDTVIYASKLNNKEIRVFEKKLKSIINDYSLNNTILYLDLTDNKLNDKDIKYPAVLIYKNGNIISYFDIKKNNYDINLLKEYLIEEGIIDND